MSFGILNDQMIHVTHLSVYNTAEERAGAGVPAGTRA